METLKTKFNDENIKTALLNNQIVIFPTETVYGIACVYDKEEAFHNLVDAKKRTPDKPFTLMLGDKSKIGEYALVNDKIKKIIDHFMPGEITLLLKPRANLYPWVTLKSEYIGIRVPAYQEVCDLINSLGKPLLVSSANMSGESAAKNFEEAVKTFDGHVSVIVEGKTRSNLPSTIVILDDNIKLVRQGNITLEEIKKVWEGK